MTVTNSFRKRFSELYDKLKERLIDGRISAITHHSIIMLTKKVITALAQSKAVVKEEATKIMGGQVLDYETKDILNEGIKQGRSIGVEDTNKLYAWLLDKGRNDDITKAIHNPQFLEQLFIEYNSNRSSEA